MILIILNVNHLLVMVNLSNSILLNGIKNKNTVIHFNIFYVL